MFGLSELFSGPLSTTLLIGISTIILLYWFSTRNHDYWKKRGIPFAKPLPFVGSLHEIYWKPLHETEMKKYNRYGSIYGYYEGNRALLSVADPDLLKDILVKDFATFSSRRIYKTGNEVFDKLITNVKGNDWKRIRTIMTPTFTTGKIKKMLTIFKECSDTLGKNFKTEAENGRTVDVKRFYGAFTMDTITSSAFSMKIDSHNNPDNEFVKAARNVFLAGVNFGLILILLIPFLAKIYKNPGPMGFFLTNIRQLIDDRKRTGQGRMDFLQLMIDTQREVKEEQNHNSPENEKSDIASNYGLEDVSQQIFKNVTSKRLSTDEIVAQCLIFFFGGYDTTATTLSFATYNLALNPVAQDKLRAEVDEALRETNGDLTYDAVQNMKYLDNVISETLRMFPPGVRLERVAEADYKLGETGITIPKGMVVTIPLMAIQMDPKLFPEPGKFDPDRFTAEERAKRHPYAYLPFGAGPRNCVAMRFALLVVKVCLAHVISHFIIKRSPHTKVPLEFTPSVSLQPKEILVDFELRTDGTVKIE